MSIKPNYYLADISKDMQRSTSTILHRLASSKSESAEVRFLAALELLKRSFGVKK